MFNRFLRSRAAAFTLAGVLAVGALTGAGAAVAVASGGGSPTPTSTQTSANAPDNTASTSATPTMTPNQQCHAPIKFRLVAGLLKDVAAKSGIDAKTLVQDLRSGKSLNDILGSNAASVQQQVLADVQAKIQQAEQSGKLTSTQAQNLSQKAPAAIAKFFSATHTGKPGAGALGRIGLTRAQLVQTAASTIGIDPTTLANDLKSGQTIAQVAGDKTQAVISALEQQVDSAIQSAAQAHNVPSDKVTTIVNRANQRISNIVNNGFPKPGSGGHLPGANCK